MKIVYRSPKMLLELTNELIKHYSAFDSMYWDSQGVYNMARNDLLIAYYMVYEFKEQAPWELHFVIRIPRRGTFNYFNGFLSCSSFENLKKEVYEIYTTLNRYNILLNRLSDENNT